MTSAGPQPWLPLARAGAAIVVIGAETFVGASLLRANPATVVLVYLLTALVVASQFGLREAVVTSLVATLCYNFFFLPPLHTFRIAEPENWVALFAFLLASLVASRLSERARRRAAEALSRQHELERLHSVSHAVLLAGDNKSAACELADAIARAYRASAVAIYDRKSGVLVTSGSEPVSADVQRKLTDASTYGGTFREGDSVVAAFGHGAKPAGSVALRGIGVSDDALDSLTNLVEIGLQKARNQEVTGRAEAARQTQEFKSTLLDALAHQFKTPLTTLQAAASGILNPALSAEQRDEFARIVEQEADRLATMVSDAIHLSRIEAGKITLERRTCSVEQLVADALAKVRPVLEDRALNVDVAAGLPMVEVDAELFLMVLRELIENAAKYATARSEIRVRVGRRDAAVAVGVWNDSPPIPDWEKPRVFEKFYRGTTSWRHSTGTGMGLAIAREVMRAHGGEIRVESSAEAGTEFTLLIPVVQPRAVS